MYQPSFTYPNQPGFAPNNLNSENSTMNPPIRGYYLDTPTSYGNYVGYTTNPPVASSNMMNPSFGVQNPTLNTMGNLYNHYRVSLPQPTGQPLTQQHVQYLAHQPPVIPSPILQEERNHSFSPISDTSSNTSGEQRGQSTKGSTAVRVCNVPNGVSVKEMLTMFKNKIPGLAAQILNEDLIAPVKVDPTLAAKPTYAFFINLETSEMALRLVNTCKGINGAFLTVKPEEEGDKQSVKKEDKKSTNEKKPQNNNSKKKEEKKDNQNTKVKKESQKLLKDEVSFKLEFDPIQIELIKSIKERVQKAINREIDFEPKALLIPGYTGSSETIKSQILKVLNENTFIKTYFCFMTEKSFNDAKKLAAKNKLILSAMEPPKRDGQELTCYLCGSNIFEQNIVQVYGMLRTRVAIMSKGEYNAVEGILKKRGLNYDIVDGTNENTINVRVLCETEEQKMEYSKLVKKVKQGPPKKKTEQPKEKKEVSEKSNKNGSSSNASTSEPLLVKEESLVIDRVSKAKLEFLQKYLPTVMDDSNSIQIQPLNEFGFENRIVIKGMNASVKKNGIQNYLEKITEISIEKYVVDEERNNVYFAVKQIIDGFVNGGYEIVFHVSLPKEGKKMIFHIAFSSNLDRHTMEQFLKEQIEKL